MPKAQQVSVWTIAWGVFWGLALWTVLTTVAAVLFWGAIGAAVLGAGPKQSQSHVSR